MDFAVVSQRELNCCKLFADVLAESSTHHFTVGLFCVNLKPRKKGFCGHKYLRILYNFIVEAHSVAASSSLRARFIFWTVASLAPLPSVWLGPRRHCNRFALTSALAAKIVQRNVRIPSRRGWCEKFRTKQGFCTVSYRTNELSNLPGWLNTAVSSPTLLPPGTHASRVRRLVWPNLASKTIDLLHIGTPRYLSNVHKSKSLSTHVRLATNSDPYVDVSIVASFLLN